MYRKTEILKGELKQNKASVSQQVNLQPPSILYMWMFLAVSKFSYLCD